MTLGDEEGAEDKLIQSLSGEAVKNVFNRLTKGADFDAISEQFKGNLTFPAGDDLPADEFVANMKTLRPLHKAATALTALMQMDPGDNALLAAVGEFVLEGLYVNNRLSKYNTKGKTFFRK